MALTSCPVTRCFLYPRLYRLSGRTGRHRPYPIWRCSEVALPAWAARVPVRSGEHGRDVGGPRRGSQNTSDPLALPALRDLWPSKDLEGLLADQDRRTGQQVGPVYNSVDAERFRPQEGRNRFRGALCRRRPGLVGTVGRIQAVKDQVTLAGRSSGLWRSPRPEIPSGS